MATKGGGGKKPSAKKAPVPKKAAGKKAPVPKKAPESKEVPPFVRKASPTERKAAVEALAEERGLGSSLANAPWKKAKPGGPPSPAQPGKPGGKSARRVEMMKAPGAAPKPATRAGPRPVLVDTNALMMQFQFHIDIERELNRLLDFGHEIVVPSTVLDELEFIAREGKGKDAGEARMAMALAKTFKTMESPGEGDTSILRLAEKLNAIVVTNDKILRARLRAKDIPNVYMRSSAFLTVEGHITGI